MYNNKLKHQLLQLVAYILYIICIICILQLEYNLFGDIHVISQYEMLTMLFPVGRASNRF